VRRERLVVCALALPACALLGVLLGVVVLLGGPRRAAAVLRRTADNLSTYAW